MPKRYGQSRVDACPFCGKQAVTISKEGIPVCLAHKHAKLNDMKCICGDYLELMTGKFGIFFKCERCGTLNMNKVFEINKIEDVSDDEAEISSGKNKKITAKPKPLFNSSSGSKSESKSFNKFSKKKQVKRKPIPPKNPKEIIVRSDDPMYFD